MEEEEAQLGRAVEALHAIDGWRQEADDVRAVLTWTVVAEHEAALATLEAKLGDDLPAAAAKADAALEELEHEAAVLDEIVTDRQRAVEEFAQRLVELRDQEEGAKKAQKAAHRAAGSLLKKVQQLETAVAEVFRHQPSGRSGVDDDRLAVATKRRRGAGEAPLLGCMKPHPDADRAAADLRRVIHVGRAHAAMNATELAGHREPRDVPPERRGRRLGQRGKLGQTDEASGAQPTEDDLLAIPLVHSSTLAPGQPVMRGFSLNIDQ